MSKSPMCTNGAKVETELGQQLFFSQTMPPLANEGASQFIPGVLPVFIMLIDVMLLSLKTNKYALIRLYTGLKPSVYQQYFGFF